MCYDDDAVHFVHSRCFIHCKCPGARWTVKVSRSNQCVARMTSLIDLDVNSNVPRSATGGSWRSNTKDLVTEVSNGFLIRRSKIKQQSYYSSVLFRDCCITFTTISLLEKCDFANVYFLEPNSLMYTYSYQIFQITNGVVSPIKIHQCFLL